MAINSDEEVTTERRLTGDKYMYTIKQCMDEWILVVGGIETQEKAKEIVGVIEAMK